MPHNQSQNPVDPDNSYHPIVVTITAEHDVSRGLLSHSSAGQVILHSTLNPVPGTEVRVDLRLAGAGEDEFFEVTATVIVHRVLKLATNVIEISGYWLHAESLGKPEPLREFLQRVAMSSGGIGRVLPPDDTVPERRFVYTFPKPPEVTHHSAPVQTFRPRVEHPSAPPGPPDPSVSIPNSQPRTTKGSTSQQSGGAVALAARTRAVERRRSMRILTLKPVLYAIKASRHPGYITNASSHGLFIQTAHEVPAPSTVVVLAIPSPRGGRIVHLNGRVIHRYTPDELPTGRGFGMEFVMTQDQYRDAEIFRFIEDFLNSL